MKERLLRGLAYVWGWLPNERAKTEILARLGPRFAVSVWAVIFDEQGRVLLFEHTHDRAHPWGLPSGRLERAESPEEALAREFREEVDGTLLARNLLAALRDAPLPTLRLAYLCHLIHPPRRASVEVRRWQFFPLDALPASVRPLQRQVIALAQAAPQRHLSEVTA